MNRIYLGTGIAGLLLCLIAYIPAPLLYHWSRDDRGPQVQALGLEGNLLRGRAASVNLAGIALRDLEWRWRPQSLLIGRISHHLRAQTDGGSLEARVSQALLGTTVRIAALKGNLPVEQLGPSVGMPVLPFSGGMRFELKRLQLRDGKPLRAEGIVEFNGLVFSFASPPVTLGSYRAELSTAQQTLQAAISSTGGAQLEATGTLQVTREGQYVLDLKLRPHASAPARVVSLLQPLGTANAEGWYLLRRNGSF